MEKGFWSVRRDEAIIMVVVLAIVWFGVLPNSARAAENPNKGLDRLVESLLKHPNCIHYVVRKGDTLYSLARKHKVSVSELRVANAIRCDNLIKIGQVLVIPLKQ